MSADKDSSKSLNLNDLLKDDSNDVLSDYLRVSVTNDGEGARVTVSTIDDSPVVYSSVLYGSTATDLSEILANFECFHDDSGV